MAVFGLFCDFDVALGWLVGYWFGLLLAAVAWLASCTDATWVWVLLALCCWC